MSKKLHTLIIASGYFNPLHVGHLEYLELSKKLGDKLLVIINNDRQAVLKHGFSFMNEKDRAQIINALECVDDIYISEDQDSTVCETLKTIHRLYKNKFNKIIFAKGGDRFNFEIPEASVCKELNIEIIDGLGLKIRASSELLKQNGVTK